MKKKVLVSAGALALAVGVTAAGTLAYLNDNTGAVKNTFTYSVEDSKIELVLQEHALSSDNVHVDKMSLINEGETEEYVVIPGATVEKDPHLLLTTKNASYIYVEVKENDPLNILTTDMDTASAWKQIGEANSGPHDGTVYYWAASAEGGTTQADAIHVFDHVTYGTPTEDITIGEGAKNPTNIEIYGYAVDASGFANVEEGWTKALAAGDFND